MGSRRDDYATTNPEPADPPITDYRARDDLRLAPPTVDVGRIPDPLVDGERALTVGEARDVYLKLERSQWQADGHTAKFERHKRYYWRLLEGDRWLQERYDGNLTTAMLTRRLSPLDSAGNWLTPWECDELLHGGTINRDIRRAVNYHLGGFEFEWAAVTSTTRTAATPHEHLYFWIDDPNDEIETDHFSPALDKHIKHCVNAYQDDHSYRADGTDGAITLRHSPPLIEENPDKLLDVIDGDTPARPNTRGAQYLASQLSHLPVSDACESDNPVPENTELDGGVTAWLSPHQWFRNGGGFPV